MSRKTKPPHHDAEPPVIETRASEPPVIARRTKRDFLVELLSDDAGMDVVRLSELLGWQAHTTRAALTGLRKRGYVIEALPPAEGSRRSRYRLASGSPA